MPTPSIPSDADDLRRWLDDIRYHIALAQQFAAGMDYVAFRDDLRTTYAVARCLEVISEASRRLPDGVKARHPSIQWRGMAAAGNIYRHEYEDVAAQDIWRHPDPSPATAPQRYRAGVGGTRRPGMIYGHSRVSTRAQDLIGQLARLICSRVIAPDLRDRRQARLAR